MAYTAAEGRGQLLEALARAIGELSRAAVALGEAYEGVDEQTGDRLEEQLFRPVQSALGRAQRTHADFAERHGTPARTFVRPNPGAPGPPGPLVRQAVEAIEATDATLAELQDSMLPVEVGDPELRANLSAVREQLGPLPGRARTLLRTLGALMAGLPITGGCNCGAVRYEVTAELLGASYCHCRRCHTP